MTGSPICRKLTAPSNKTGFDPGEHKALTRAFWRRQTQEANISAAGESGRLQIFRFQLRTSNAALGDYSPMIEPVAVDGIAMKS